MKQAWFAIALTLTASSLYAQAIWTGPAGGGMLGIQEPWVASAGNGAGGIVMDNYDRDPLGLDINELRASLRIGLGHNIEFYGSWYFSRAVTIPGAHPAPSSPVDIVVVSDTVPSTPYRATYLPLPYTGQRSSSVGDMVPGDVILGMKRLLWNQQGIRPAFSVSANVILPTSHDLHDLHRGSGSGSTDVAMHSAAAWTVQRWTLAANLGYIHSGGLPYSDRIITTHGFTDLELERPDFIRTTAGTRFRAHRRVSLMAEMFHLHAVGSRTPTQDSVGATDILAGLQVNLGHFALTAGYRQHLWPPSTKTQRPTGLLSGAINLCDVPEAQREAYLKAIGAPLTGHRADASLLIVGAPSDVPLPAGAYRLPDTYPTSTTGNGGTNFAITFTF